MVERVHPPTTSTQPPECACEKPVWSFNRQTKPPQELLQVFRSPDHRNLRLVWRIFHFFWTSPVSSGSFFPLGPTVLHVNIGSFSFSVQFTKAKLEQRLISWGSMEKFQFWLPGFLLPGGWRQNRETFFHQKWFSWSSSAGEQTLNCRTKTIFGQLNLWHFTLINTAPPPTLSLWGAEFVGNAYRADALRLP